jgi:hypothetical protein
MAVLTIRLGARVFQVNTSELQEVQDPETIRRSGRSPHLVRLGFAAWSEDADAPIDDRLAVDEGVTVPDAAALTTAEVNALRTTLVVVRRQESVYLLDGLDPDRQLVARSDARARRWHARARQSPFLVGLSFAAAVEDQELLSRPTDSSCVEL